MKENMKDCQGAGQTKRKKRRWGEMRSEVREPVAEVVSAIRRGRRRARSARRGRSVGRWRWATCERRRRVREVGHSGSAAARRSSATSSPTRTTQRSAQPHENVLWTYCISYNYMHYNYGRGRVKFQFIKKTSIWLVFSCIIQKNIFQLLRNERQYSNW